jgi:hypothetical protein
MVDRGDAVVTGDPRRYSHGRFTCRDLGQGIGRVPLVTGDDTRKDVS